MIIIEIDKSVPKIMVRTAKLSLNQLMVINCKSKQCHYDNGRFYHQFNIAAIAD